MLTNDYEREFNRLKTMGFISPRRQIHRRRKGNLQASVFTNNTIHYNYLIEMPIESIAFCLLHEEGHLHNRKGPISPISMIVSLYILCFLLIFYYVPLPRLLIDFLMVLLVLGGIRLFNRYLRKDEKEADLWAKERYSRIYPSVPAYIAVSNAFTKISSHHGNIIIRCISRILLFLVKDPHPPDQERIDYLRD